jgi:hypothetical protein
LIRLSFFCFYSFISQQVNPTALNTTAIDCEKLYAEEVAWAENSMVNSLNKFDNSDVDYSKKFEAYSNCLIKKFRESNLIEKLFAFDYLGEKEHSPLEKDKLRLEFVAIYVRFSHEAMGCASGLQLQI